MCAHCIQPSLVCVSTDAMCPDDNARDRARQSVSASRHAPRTPEWKIGGFFRKIGGFFINTCINKRTSLYAKKNMALLKLEKCKNLAGAHRGGAVLQVVPCG